MRFSADAETRLVKTIARMSKTYALPNMAVRCQNVTCGVDTGPLSCIRHPIGLHKLLMHTNQTQGIMEGHLHVPPDLMAILT